jgi:hypothetical protein
MGAWDKNSVWIDTQNFSYRTTKINTFVFGLGEFNNNLLLPLSSIDLILEFDIDTRTERFISDTFEFAILRRYLIFDTNIRQENYILLDLFKIQTSKLNQASKMLLVGHYFGGNFVVVSITTNLKTK